MKERVWINGVASDTCFSLLPTHWRAVARMCLQFNRNRICTPTRFHCWLVPQHDDQSKALHEGLNLDQSCGQPDCVSAQTPALRCTMSVRLQFDRNQICTSNFCLRNVTDGLRSLWKLPVDGLDEFLRGAYSCDENLRTQYSPVFGLGFHASA